MTKTVEEVNRDALLLINKMINDSPALRSTFETKSPRFRYWGGKKDGYAFCYTTELVNKMYCYLKYRVTKDGVWRLKQKREYLSLKTARRDAFQQH